MKKYIQISCSIILLCLSGSFNSILALGSVSNSIIKVTDKNSLGTLKIKWAGVIDNGEGDKCPHGPTGSLHVLIYPASYGCPGDRKSYSGFYNESMLRGPESRDFCTDFDIFPEPDREWLDGDAMLMNLSVYEWNKSDEEVILFIYEADPGGVGRCHDMIACFRISRLSTINNLSIISDDFRQAKDDAIKNCRKRGITWHENIWSGGVNIGIPKIFLQIITE